MGYLCRGRDGVVAALEAGKELTQMIDRDFDGRHVLEELKDSA